MSSVEPDPLNFTSRLLYVCQFTLELHFEICIEVQGHYPVTNLLCVCICELAVFFEILDQRCVNEGFECRSLLVFEFSTYAVIRI